MRPSRKPAPAHEAVATEEAEEPEAPTSQFPTPLPLKTSNKKLPAPPVAGSAPSVSMNVAGKRIAIPARPRNSMPSLDAPDVRKFRVEDGVAVIDGDIVLGVPSDGGTSGVAQVPSMKLWSTREIPYHIQPSVPNPGRVLDALSYFSSTYVSFVPYTNQEDVLVFQAGTGTCKSYVGQTGGKQPIWLSPGCGAHEIAHEVMHALGFTHEQNRIDRDRYVKLNPENIEPDKLTNFEKLPQEFMQASGGADFSFNSIMIYPPDMFSSNGRPTMTSLVNGETIAPSEKLSEQDISRLNRVYGTR